MIRSTFAAVTDCRHLDLPSAKHRQDHSHRETTQDGVQVGDPPEDTSLSMSTPSIKASLILRQSKCRRQRESLIILKTQLSAFCQVSQFLCSSSFSTTHCKGLTAQDRSYSSASQPTLFFFFFLKHSKVSQNNFFWSN